jgi:acyl carrier protein
MSPKGSRLELKRLIIESLHLAGLSADLIGDDDPLFGPGSDLGLDSVDALELVVVLEKAYGVKIKSHEVGADEFTSVASLAAFLDRKLESDRGLEG